MVFESQHPGRRAQNMAALLALVIMLGILLPIPIGAGFADWINQTNAPTSLDERYVASDAFDLIGDDALYTKGEYAPYFNWYNGSDSPLNQVNVTLVDGVLSTNDDTSVDENQIYALNAEDEAAPDWKDGGIPYWEVYFDYTPKMMYDDNIVQIGIVMTSPLKAGTPNIVNDSKQMLSFPTEDYDEEDFEAVTVTLSAGGVDLYKTIIPTDDNGKIADEDQKVIIETSTLREAVMNGGDDYIKLTVTGHDIRDINMTGSALYTYNATKLFGRDDGLFITSMISIIMAALGIFLVQPRWNLPLGNRPQGGRRRF